MAVSRRLVVWWTLALAACGGGGDEGPVSAPALDSGAPGGNPSADASVQADAAQAPTDAGKPSAADAGAPSDAGPAVDAAPLVLAIPKSEVQCAGAACDTLVNVCCSAWSKTAGFSSTESCITRDACYKLYTRSPDTANRAVTRECDGKEDCSGGQVCCVYADGAPLYSDYSDIFHPKGLYGPGGSTICADEADCTYDNRTTFVTNGIPLGEIECNDDGDCADRAGTSCQPELDGSHSTGDGVQARAEVKVCR